MPKKSICELNGYRLIFAPEHPKAMFGSGYYGYVYEHILVAEQSLGRPLNDDEIVHHLDSNRANNRKANLLILLNSQHSKLHHWLDNRKAKTKPKYCITCGKTLQDKQKKYCSDACRGPRYKVERPSAPELLRELNAMPLTHIGRKYGVTDNAIKKWAKAYGIQKTQKHANSNDNHYVMTNKQR